MTKYIVRRWPFILEVFILECHLPPVWPGYTCPVLPRGGPHVRPAGGHLVHTEVSCVPRRRGTPGRVYAVHRRLSRRAPSGSGSSSMSSLACPNDYHSLNFDFWLLNMKNSDIILLYVYTHVCTTVGGGPLKCQLLLSIILRVHHIFSSYSMAHAGLI